VAYLGSKGSAVPANASERFFGSVPERAAMFARLRGFLSADDVVFTFAKIRDPKIP